LFGGVLLVTVLAGGLGYCFATGTMPIRFPDLTWWNGIAFWSMVLAAITLPRVYLSLPKAGGLTVKQLAPQGAESRSWLLLVGALFLVNAALIRNPDVQDIFITDALRLLDTRFFTSWHWAFFFLGAGGFFARYLLGTRMIVAELQEKPTDALFFGCHLASICGSTFTATFLCSKFSLVSSIVAFPFQWNFPGHYWSIIWVVLAAEIVFFVGLKHHFFDGFTKYFSGTPSFSLRSLPLPKIALIVVGFGIVAASGVIAWKTIKFSELPWWAAPAFWSLVIVVALWPKLRQVLPQRPPTFGIRGKNRPSFRFGFDRKILVYAALLLVGLGVVGGIGYVFTSGAVRFSELPWWIMPAFWSTIIIGGVSYRVIEGVRAYLKESVARPQTQRKPQTVGRPVAFNAAKSSDGTRSFAVNPILWIGLAGVIGVLVLGYWGYSLLTMQSVDADGHPIAMSWWVWPSFLLLVFAAAAAYPLFKTLRENFASVSRPTARPTVAPKAVKPVGFNTTAKQKNTQKTLWQLPSLPQFEGLNELLPMVGIGVLALIGLLIVGYIGYSLSTMEWIDADGHPVPMPWWIIPLLLILVVLGAVGYKVVSVLRENSGDSRSSSIRSAPTKASKPGGFNAAGFGKKRVGFNQMQNGNDWFANPVLWLGILGGVVALLLLVIIFMLVF